MKLRIFALAFTVGFVFCFSAAAFFVCRFTPQQAADPEKEETESAVFLEEESAVFLLVFKEGDSFGPFTIVNFDAERGRIPVFTFSKKAALDYGGVTVSAEALLSSVSPKAFAGAVENSLKIELSGYFICDRAAVEALISKAGSFDYVLSKDLYYSGGTSYINLLSGVQNINGKKFCDIITFPKFSEAERCDTVSRMTAVFFNRRLRRFLPESNLYSTLFNYAETDISAFDKEKYSKLIEVLCSSGESLSGHITNDTERDPSTGLLYFSEKTEERIIRYFGT